MNLQWGDSLKDGELSNPVIWDREVEADPPLPYPSIGDLRRIWPKGTKGWSLKTWNRTPGVRTLDPHWIGVYNGTTLHNDIGYPRYTHQLILRADNYCIRGRDHVRTKLARGHCISVDTHSPHQLWALDASALWYVAASIDAKTRLRLEEVLPDLIAFARTNPFLTREVLVPNVGGRPRPRK